mmetsp:Transcript_1708/g.4968  ORF Transcript_1708/g.4968 Transcript_1708/m.4968 type:complete len:226 (-) Transcript_1708:743-1420(-)
MGTGVTCCNVVNQHLQAGVRCLPSMGRAAGMAGGLTTGVAVGLTVGLTVSPGFGMQQEAVTPPGGLRRQVRRQSRLQLLQLARPDPCMVQGGGWHLQLSAQIRAASYIHRRLLPHVCHHRMRRPAHRSAHLSQQAPPAVHGGFAHSVDQCAPHLPDVRHPGDVERIGVGLLGARGGGLQDGTMRQHSAAAAGQHIPLFLAHGLAAAHPPHDARWGAVDGDRRQRP